MAGRAGNAALSRVVALSLMLSLGFPLAGLAYQDTGFDQGRAETLEDRQAKKRLPDDGGLAREDFVQQEAGDVLR